MEPLNTWTSNVLGTVHVLEAARQCPSVRAILVVTTDKCYRNDERTPGYREDDALGGAEPYSASKASVELVAESYQRSYFADGKVLLATARAGNVIGGGDWSEDRLMADAARAVKARLHLPVHQPHATRPWQHVLDCLQGYLQLSSNLLAGNSEFARPFNFGPADDDNRTVGEVLQILSGHWSELRWHIDETT